MKLKNIFKKIAATVTAIAIVAGSAPTSVFAANTPKHTLYIKYVDQHGTSMYDVLGATSAAKSVKDRDNTYMEGTTYNEVSPVVAGYDADQTAITGTMGTSDISKKVTYTAKYYPLTIHYVYENGSTAASDYTENVQYNETYEHASPTIKGYTPTKSTVTGTMGLNGAVEKVTYTANDVNIKIHYVNENGDQVHTDYTGVVKYGTEYSVTSPTVEGYDCQQTVVSGTADETNEITVKYTAKSYNITVNFVDDTGKVVLTNTDSVKFGKKYDYVYPSITGYTVGAEGLHITCTGDRTETVNVTRNSYKLTVHYLYGDGSKAFDDVTSSVLYNDTYSIESPTAPEGYTVDHAIATGTMPAKDTETTVYYMAKGDAKYTVNYVDSEGNVIKEAETVENVLYNSDVVVTAPAITGYTISGDAKQTAKPNYSGASITFTYTANEHKVTVHYVYEDGTTVFDDAVEKVNFNKNYEITTPDKTGYTPNSTVISGTLTTDEDQEFTVKYTVNTDASYTVHYVDGYVDGKGNTLLADKEVTNQTYGAEITEKAADIKYYSPKDASQKVIASYSDNEITFTYTPNEYTVTVHYKDADGEKTFEDQSQTVAYGSTYKIVTPDVTDYTASESVIEGTMESESFERTVTYKHNPVSITIHYVDDSDTPKTIKEDTVITDYEYNTAYAVTVDDIEGYTKTQSIVSGTAKESATNVHTVKFTTNSYPVKFTYVEDGNESNVLGEYTDTVKYGASRTFTHQTFTGFTLSDGSYTIDSMPAHAINETIKATRNTYKLTIHYVYADGTTKAFKDFEANVNYEEQYGVQSPEDVGYTANIATVEGTMGAANVERTVIYSPKGDASYTVHYVDTDGKTIQKDLVVKDVSYNTPVTVTAPEIYGYTASGKTSYTLLPDYSGESCTFTYTPNEHTVTVNYEYEDGSKAADSVVEKVAFNSSYEISTPSITGYDPTINSVSGKLTADENITVTVTYKASTDARYIVHYVDTDGKEVSSDDVVRNLIYGKEYTVSAAAVDHYTVDEDTKTVKAGYEDNEITFVYTPDTFKITYEVDGEVYKEIEDVPYNSTIALIDDDMTKEGYTFSGWSTLPETMPADDLVITGSYTINTHSITYMLDGEEYEVIKDVEYGTELTLIDDEMVKDGYDFSGWSELPETMPDEDLTITGEFVAHKHTITYKINGEVYKEFTDIDYGTALKQIEDDMNRDGYEFSGWSEMPETMGDEDIVITGEYKIVKTDAGKGTGVGSQTVMIASCLMFASLLGTYFILSRRKKDSE